MKESAWFTKLADQRVVDVEATSLAATLAFIENTDGEGVDNTELVLRLLLSGLPRYFVQIFVGFLKSQWHGQRYLLRQ